MEIFWAIVGALSTAYNWVRDTISEIGITNLLLFILIWQVGKIYETIREVQIDFETAMLERDKLDIEDDNLL
jgi:hypothetical protein